MGPPDTPSLSLDPGTLRVQEQAKADRIAVIQDKVSQETRDTLIRFGRRKAFAGAGDMGGGVTSGGLQGFGGSL